MAFNSYKRKIWKTGDIITASDLNNMEKEISTLNGNGCYPITTSVEISETGQKHIVEDINGLSANLNNLENYGCVATVSKIISDANETNSDTGIISARTARVLTGSNARLYLIIDSTVDLPVGTLYVDLVFFKSDEYQQEV